MLRTAREWLDLRAWAGRRSSDYRHLSYFLVYDALKLEGCPICRLVIRWSERFLDGLLYESVTDPYVRARIREGRGFCNWHAWMMPKIHTAASGVAAFHEDVLTQEIERLHRPAPSRRRAVWRGRLPALVSRVREPRAPLCAACAIEGATTEANSLAVLVESVADPDFFRGFTESFGLCLPHFRLLEGLHPDHPNLPAIRRIELAKLEALRAELREFLRRQDYRFNREAMGPERDSWRRSIEMLVGKAHVFGPQRGLAPIEPETAAAGHLIPDPPAAAGEEILRLRDLAARYEKDAEAIRARLNEADSRLASLNFRLFELEQDRQALELCLAGTEADERAWRRIAEGLRAAQQPTRDREA